MHLWEWEHYILTDFLDGERTAAYSEFGLSKEGDFVLLKAHPVLCGLMLFRMNLTLQGLGITVSNSWPGALIPNVLHLYNACLSEGLLDKHWSDLEAVILANSAQRIFNGNSPQAPREYLRRYMLATGNSVTMFSANRRFNDAQYSKREPRQMLKESVIAGIYSKQFLRHSEERDEIPKNPVFTLEAIEKLLEAASVTDTDYTNETLTSCEDASETPLTRKQGAKTLLAKFSKSRKLTTVQLLSALEANMLNEAFSFNVDYLSLHMRCYELLRTIKEEMELILISYFGALRDYQIPYIPSYILRFVAGKELDTFSRPTEGNGRGEVLAAVSAIMMRFIKRDGETEIEKVKNACCSFSGIAFEKPYVPLNLNMSDLQAAVEAFNKLPRHKMIPSSTAASQKLNHWQSSLRIISRRLSFPDLIYFISPNNHLWYHAVPNYSIRISRLKPTDQVDIVVFLILKSFVKGILTGQDAHLLPFAPWTWSCDDTALTQGIRSKLIALGVRRELCLVKSASEQECQEADHRWNTEKTLVLNPMM
ncbi:hypothetical protein HYALB_00003858 [Hymenoscyphus albidus]|uniref:Uncharacterized protein n=1 Tax=Hymenoscyphus albidus TaxID=595503 RepID=A0A9N9LU27_9HELO|nr:hypothetical protein HYALB_00003858 [Hymenoscyphus albidus]